MTLRQGLVTAAAVVAGVLLQTAVVPALPLPGPPPDLLVVLVAAVGLARGPASGLVVGFGAGLLADLLADHAAGRLALAYAVAGALSGRSRGQEERSALLPFLVVGAAAAGAVLLFAAEGVLLGDPRATGGVVLPALGASVAYALVLVPLVVPAVAAVLRRLDPDPDRW